MARAYYNEHDPFKAAWLRKLIRGRHIAVGDVDERDIQDVPPSDLAGYVQCHFFAGVGVWNGAPARVGRLRGYGDAINSEAATQIIHAYLKLEAAQ